MGCFPVEATLFSLEYKHLQVFFTLKTNKQIKQKNKTNFPGPCLALFFLPFLDQVLERSSKFAFLLPHLLDALPLAIGLLFTLQLWLILPKFPPDVFCG